LLNKTTEGNRMTDYLAIFAEANRNKAPGVDRDNFEAGIAAVVRIAEIRACRASIQWMSDNALGGHAIELDAYLARKLGEPTLEELEASA
jgi:hypothetical protein